MIKQTVIGTLAIALGCSVGCGAANADENKLTKEEGIGMASGAAAGAIVGGPVGAFVGLMVGGIYGDTVGVAKRAEFRAQQLQKELIDTRIALAQASERAGGDEMLDALAQRLHADVMFRTASSDVDTRVASNLKDLGKLLAAHPQLQVQLHGFADPRGKAKENLELSLRRADTVREALIRGGAAPEQIRIAAHGEDLATAAKGDIEAFAWERRVSLAILPGDAQAVAQNQ